MVERSFSCMWSKDGAVKKHKRWSDGSAVFADGIFTVTDGDDNKVTSTRLQQSEAAACLKPDTEFRAGSVAIQILREHQLVQGAASTAAASAASASCAESLPVRKSIGGSSSGAIAVKRTSLGQLNRSTNSGSTLISSSSSSSSSSSTLLSKGPRKPFVTPRASSISVKRVGAVPSASSSATAQPRPFAATSSYAAAASRSIDDDDAAVNNIDGDSQSTQAVQQQAEKKAVAASQPSAAAVKAPAATATAAPQQQQQANNEDLVLEVRSGQVLKLGMMLARQMKQHQRDGVQFMWSVLASGGGNAQRGCILADEVSTINTLCSILPISVRVFM
jgi:chemotaxis protein histidine kinase CheA